MKRGLIGAVDLVPAWMLKGRKGMLALDLGGTNFRAGIVTFRNAQPRIGECGAPLESNAGAMAERE